MNPIAVIGGGWAGIAAAVKLTAQGQRVTLFEAGRVLGGRARSVQIDGRTVDNGQHILLGAYRDTLALMRQVGADPDTLLDRRPLQIRNNRAFHMALPRWPAPLHVAWGLLTAKGASLGEKLRMAWWMEGVKRCGYQLPQDLSVSDWLAANGQHGAFVEHLWGPLCLAALNTPPEHASAQIFCNVLRDSLGSPRRADTDLLLPKVPLGQLLPEPASDWLRAKGAELRLGHRVKSLETATTGVSIDGETFSAAILATAPQHAAALTGEAQTLEFEPIATVYLAYPSETRLPFPMLALSGGVGQWVIDRGDGLLGCVLSGHGDWEALSDDALAIRLAAELALPTAPLWHGVIREKRATFSCRPGLSRSPAATASPRLWRAGDYTWADYPSTIEGAVRSGLRAATATAAAAAAAASAFSPTGAHHV